MISQFQLGTRLVGGNSDYNSNGSSSNGSNNNEKPKFGVEKPASANSGYSADGSASATVPPVFIDFLDAHKRNGDQGEKNVNIEQSRDNRRKATELSFTASRAMKDLEKGGLPIPTIRKEKTRDLEGCKIDMTKVKLVMAKTVKESPFLINRSEYDYHVIPHSTTEYESLFAATYQSYEKNDASQWDSSTSSVTSSESDDIASMPPPAVVLPPLLEDALKANEAMKKVDSKRAGSKRKRPNSSEAVAKVAKLFHITMNDALEASSEARVVTLSFKPFIVVHVNTAYARLTGFSSAKILGRPLQDCLGATCKDWTRSKALHPIAALHERIAPIRSKGNKHQHCKFRATLVGPQLEGKQEVDTTSVTHYAVSFLPVSASTPKSVTGGGEKATAKASRVAPASAKATLVMG